MSEVDLKDLLDHEVDQAILIPHLPNAKAFVDNRNVWYNITANTPRIEDVVMWGGDVEQFVALLDCLINGPFANAPLAELTDTKQGGSSGPVDRNKDFIQYLIGLENSSLAAIVKPLHREGGLRY